MEMNPKMAFKILGLGPGASLAQVKKSFRDLAKQYHPDRFSPDPSPTSPNGETFSASAEARLNRMKEINQAFHFLVPLLTSTHVSTDKTSTDIPPSTMAKKVRASRDRDSSDKASSGKDISFLDLLKMLKKRFVFYNKPGSQPNPIVQPPLKPRERPKNNPMKKVRFATILNTLHPAGTVDKKRMNRGRDCRTPSRDSKRLVPASGDHPYNRFLKYMALKKQIDARKRPGGEQNYSRIEKIRPVTRVNPIGNKQKS